MILPKLESLPGIVHFPWGVQNLPPVENHCFILCVSYIFNHESTLFSLLFHSLPNQDLFLSSCMTNPHALHTMCLLSLTPIKIDLSWLHSQVITSEKHSILKGVLTDRPSARITTTFPIPNIIVSM